MLNSFFLANMTAEAERNFELPLHLAGSYFEMKTCQRHLACGMSANISEFKRNIGLDQFEPKHDVTEFYQGIDAYRFLLEVVCGLKSKLIGENEIVKQFKDAYRSYLNKESRSDEANLSPILEKILQDSKKLRTHFLTEIGQHSYASIAHKILKKEKSEPLLVIGSGKLADELVAYFIKKRPVSLTSRNADQLKKFQEKYPTISIVEWNNHQGWQAHSHILNTIGVINFVLLNDSFFDAWLTTNNSSKIMIDFGKPSSISTNHKSPIYYQLDDIFALGALSEEQKLSKVAMAQNEISRLIVLRSSYFTHSNKEENKEDTLNSLNSMIKPSYVSY